MTSLQILLYINKHVIITKKMTFNKLLTNSFIQNNLKNFPYIVNIKQPTMHYLSKKARVKWQNVIEII